MEALPSTSSRRGAAQTIRLVIYCVRLMAADVGMFKLSIFTIAGDGPERKRNAIDPKLAPETMRCAPF